MFKGDRMTYVDKSHTQCGVTDSLMFLLSDFNDFNRDLAVSLLKCY